MNGFHKMHTDTLSNNLTAVVKVFQKMKKKNDDNNTISEHLRNNKCPSD